MKKCPYFMKNKDWYNKNKLEGKTNFDLTKLGWAVPEVVKSYMEYYGIPREYIFKYATDYSLETEFRMQTADSIAKKMKARGSTDPKIDAAVCEFLNIDKFIAKEDKEAIDKIIAQKDSKK